MQSIKATGSDDTSALQKVLDSLGPREVLRMEGAFKITAPIAAMAGPAILDARGAFLEKHFAGGALLTLGFPSKSPIAGGSAGSGWTVLGLGFHYPTSGGAEAYFVNQSTALCLQNIYAGSFVDLDIDGFGVGLSLVGDGTGCTYNDIKIRQLVNCQTSLKMRTLNGGFVTEQTIHGGRWQCGPVAKDAPQVHIDAEDAAAIRINDARLEGWGAKLTKWARLASCVAVSFNNCGYDTVDGSDAPITLDPKTYNCALIGAPSDKVIFEDASAGKNGHVYLPGWR